MDASGTPLLVFPPTTDGLDNNTFVKGWTTTFTN